MPADRRVINPWTWQGQFNFVQANEVSDVQRTLFCAGQTSVDDEGSPMHPEDMRGQISQALNNIETVLENAGFELSLGRSRLSARQPAARGDAPGFSRTPGRD
jgi:enamine deaminase RidA (YjgF/YER057c/UK114 family)